MQVCCPREEGWDSGAGAVNNKDVHGISQRRVLMRTDFAVREHARHVMLVVSMGANCTDVTRCVLTQPMSTRAHGSTRIPFELCLQLIDAIQTFPASIDWRTTPHALPAS